MKHILKGLLLAVALLFCVNNAVAQKGQQAFGFETGYTSHNRSALLGAFYHYNILDNLRIAPDLGFVFRNHEQEAVFVDMNFHMPMQIMQHPIQLYPLVGLNYTSWGVHYPLEGLPHRHWSKWGLNAGAGFQLRASDRILLKIEAKYTVTSRFSTFVLDFGLGYIF